MPPTYKIHPGIGIARLGDSPDDFYIGPEAPGALPIACDAQGNPHLSADGKTVVRIDKFKDGQGRIKRQAARFQVYVYDDTSPEGRPLKLGDKVEGGGNAGTLIDIQWRVYLANKKASWYEFQQLEGEHGYAPDHPRRNKNITDPEARQRLIIDPGPRSVDLRTRRRAHFNRDGQNTYAPTFPPKLSPHSIDTLGELLTDNTGRLLVLGGYGNSGSFQVDEFGQPRIETYANNDGWFDDTSDGPVMARLVMFSELVQATRFIDVEAPSWVIVGYPRYAPQILDMVTLDDVVEDLAIREFADRTDLYGKVGTFADPQHIDPRSAEALLAWKNEVLDWNPAYRPWFYRDIWPILFRPDQFSYLSNILGQSNFPHNQSTRGKFNVKVLSVPPMVDPKILEHCERQCLAKSQSGELVSDRLQPIYLQIESTLDRELSRYLTHLRTADEKTATVRQADDTERLTGLLEVSSKTIASQRFDDFADAVTHAVGAFHDAVRPAQNVVQDSPEASTTQAVPDEESPNYRNATVSLEETVDAIIDDLPRKALERWSAAAPSYRDELSRFLDALLSADLIEPLRKAAHEALREYRAGKLLRDCKQRCLRRATLDPHYGERQYLLAMLRRPGEENQFNLRGKPNNRTYGLPMMPLLNGDNPLSNTLPSKFLRLTDYQLFVLRQWANGLFFNEIDEGWSTPNPLDPYEGWVNRTGRDLDRGVLSNMLGGSFCPGGEVTWIIRNPSIYREPYRLKADPMFYAFRETAAQANNLKGQVPDEDYSSYEGTPLSQSNNFDVGLQPGDLTKTMAVPWQSDFNECTTQDVDVTYAGWVELYPDSEGDSKLKRSQRVWETMWWPAHRPLQVFENLSPPRQDPSYVMLDWSRGIPQTSAGDLKMVVAWTQLGFVVLNPDPKEHQPTTSPPNFRYISVERNQEPSR